jgi:type II secretory ATPase GspE/PulE/Tfp pilus assembly ATPase PilB-like protein
VAANPVRTAATAAEPQCARFSKWGDSLRRAISRGAQTEVIHEEAAKQGFRSMRFQALKKLLAGITTSQEVIRLTRA